MEAERVGGYLKSKLVECHEMENDGGKESPTAKEDLGETGRRGGKEKRKKGTEKYT